MIVPIFAIANSCNFYKVSCARLFSVHFINNFCEALFISIIIVFDIAFSLLNIGIFNVVATIPFAIFIMTET